MKTYKKWTGKNGKKYVWKMPNWMAILIGATWVLAGITGIALYWILGWCLLG